MDESSDCLSLTKPKYIERIHQWRFQNK